MPRHQSRRSGLIIVLTFMTSMLSSTGSAATHFVRTSATGNGSGSDWLNAALDLPKSLVRGDTYYMACGAYAAHDFVDSGTTTITVKAATASDHGSSIGWSTTYGVDSGGCQVSIPSISIGGGGNYVIDGNFPNSRPDVGGFGKQGIKIDITRYTCNSPNCYSIYISANNPNVTLRNIECNGHGQDNPNGNTCFYAVAGTPTNYTLQYMYMHDFGIGGGPLKTSPANTLVFDHNFVARNSSTDAQHSELWSSTGSNNITISNNVFLDAEGTGYIVELNSGAAVSTSNWLIYGNVFAMDQTPPGQTGIGGDGVIAVINGNAASNWLIYNNSFVNITSPQNLASGIEISGTGNVVENNIWYHCNNVNLGGTLNDYNFFSNNSNSVSETHGQQSSVDPFAGWAKGNYHLNVATVAGLNLPSPYNLDADGNTRALDGTWDRGAYEFNSAATRPNSPTAVTTVVH